MYDAKGLHPQACSCPRVTVDVVIFALGDDSLRVLLTKRKREPHEGTWAIPGGEIQPGEALRAAACRKLEEQTGIGDLFLEQLYTFGDPGRDPRQRVITVAYYAALPASGGHGKVTEAEESAHWWPAHNLPKLAFDHARVIEYAVTRLRHKLEYTAVGFELLPDSFTLSELQRVYELVLGEALDKRNFRRKVLGARVIEPTAGQRTGDGRPAQLYRYRQDALAEVQARRLFP